jgi:hypothetical protein
MMSGVGFQMRIQNRDEITHCLGISVKNFLFAIMPRLRDGKK